MSRSARLKRFFGEGDHEFALTIGAADELEEVRGEALRKLGYHNPGHAAVMAINGRLASGQFLNGDLRDTIRLALIGAGMEREDAFRLVERGLKPGSMLKGAQLAADIIDTFLTGDPTDIPGADLGEGGGPPAPIQPGTPMDDSDGPGSTDRVPPSD